MLVPLLARHHTVAESEVAMLRAAHVAPWSVETCTVLMVPAKRLVPSYVRLATPLGAVLSTRTHWATDALAVKKIQVVSARIRNMIFMCHAPFMKWVGGFNSECDLVWCFFTVKIGKGRKQHPGRHLSMEAAPRYDVTAGISHGDVTALSGGVTSVVLGVRPRPIDGVRVQIRCCGRSTTVKHMRWQASVRVFPKTILRQDLAPAIDRAGGKPSPQLISSLQRSIFAIASVLPALRNSHLAVCFA